MNKQKRVLIIGGGFAGISCARTLSNIAPELSIALISDRPHFEYTPSLYRVVTGHSPLEVCVPLADIFEDTNVIVVEDSVADVHIDKRTCIGTSGSEYRFDYVVLALGSETNYYNIHGLAETSFGMKSINEGLRLKEHLHELFTDRALATPDEQITAGNIVVVGGGAAGVELAAELAHYARMLADAHGLDESFITIDLVEAKSRILSQLPEAFAYRVTERLRELGVNVFVNRRVTTTEPGKIYLQDMEMDAETLIWTAGVQTNRRYRDFKGFTFDERGRVVVDRYLQAKGTKGIFIAGDAAATATSGMAQTAIADGKTVARSLVRLIAGEEPLPYRPKKTGLALPLGDGWAAVSYGKIRLYGLPGWFLRRGADLRYFLTILPIKKALAAFLSDRRLTENCPVCSDNDYYIGSLEDRKEKWWEPNKASSER